MPGNLNTGLLTISSVGRYTEDQFLVNWDRHFRGDKGQSGVALLLV